MALFQRVLRSFRRSGQKLTTVLRKELRRSRLTKRGNCAQFSESFWKKREEQKKIFLWQSLQCSDSFVYFWRKMSKVQSILDRDWLLDRINVPRLNEELAKSVGAKNVFYPFQGTFDLSHLLLHIDLSISDMFHSFILHYTHITLTACTTLYIQPFWL